MKYAIISDVHGNKHALEAVLTDAKTQNVDRYLLLGDYVSNFPYGNDVTNIIRNLESCVVIRGNGEGYMENLRGSNLEDMTCEQFKPVYRAYSSLTARNLEYLINLPETATITDSSTSIHLAHSMDLFYRSPMIELFHSERLRHILQRTPFTHEEYLAHAKAALLSCPEALAEIEALPKGIYLFGHNHIQFFMEHKGRLFVNPGSCGEPLDCDTRPAYTILTLTESDWIVDERRITYDSDSVANGLIASGFSSYAPMWSEIIGLELRTGKDYFMPFVIHLVETGRKMGTTEFPINNEVWNLAVSTWDANNV